MTEMRGWILWRFNTAACGGVCLWILADGRFAQAANALWTAVTTAGTATAPLVYGPLLSWRVVVLAALAVGAVVSLAGVFAALFVGAASHRRLRSWLAFTALVAGWLALGTSWREVAWWGQQCRVEARLAEFTAIAMALHSDWPGDDGERAGLGAFMAYPQGAPRMLLMLTPPAAPRAGLRFSAIERAENGALRFELADSEHGAWLEWHAPGDVPSSFVGGLMGDYRLQRSASLGGGWFLARYGGS